MLYCECICALVNSFELKNILYVTGTMISSFVLVQLDCRPSRSRVTTLLHWDRCALLELLRYHTNEVRFLYKSILHQVTKTKHLHEAIRNEQVLSIVN